MKKILILLLFPLCALAQDCPPGQIKVPNGNGHWKCEPGKPLPVELIEFRAFEASVTWVTVSEENASHYILETSPDTRTWSEAARVEAKGPSRYTVQVRPNYYYRLRQIDVNGDQAVYLIDNRTMRREGSYQDRGYDTTGRWVK